jgi:hypothetical protein
MFLVVYSSTNKQLKRTTQWGIDEFRWGSAEPNASMPAPPQETQQKIREQRQRYEHIHNTHMTLE